MQDPSPFLYFYHLDNVPTFLWYTEYFNIAQYIHMQVRESNFSLSKNILKMIAWNDSSSCFLGF